MHEAKTHLSREVAGLRPGDRLILCNRNRPVAEVRLLWPQPGQPRRLGLARGEFVVPDSFFKPLVASLVDGFEGKA